jgi:pimeloyl-ACP methyl ester carboxylesterase
MAARFWQGVLLLEVASSVLLGMAVRAAFSLPARALLVLVPVIFALFPWVLAACTLPLANVRASALLRSLFSMEPAHFNAAALVMSAEKWGHPSTSDRRRPVLLIHGLLCNRALWHRLSRRLSEAGWGPVHAVNLEPLRADLDGYAKTIEHELAALQERCGGERVTIITHSMGGLVARAALRTVGSAVIRRIVTVACPHHGTLFGRHLSLKPLPQMRPASAWLQAINAAEELEPSVPLTSIYSLDDVLVVPPGSAALAGARCEVLRGLGHFGLLRAPGAIDRILGALAGE